MKLTLYLGECKRISDRTEENIRLGLALRNALDWRRPIHHIHLAESNSVISEHVKPCGTMDGFDSQVLYGHII